MAPCCKRCRQLRSLQPNAKKGLLQQISKVGHTLCQDDFQSNCMFCNFFSGNHHQSVTEKLERVTPTVEVKTYGSLGK